MICHVKRFVLVFACVGILHASQAQSDEQIQSLLDSLQQASGYPGMVFTYIDASGAGHAFASGWADKENDVAMTTEHKLHGGSTGKTVVSAVIMQLLLEDKLSLDDPVKKYLGDRPWFNRLANAGQITVRHLLQHTSGIVRYEFKEAFLKELAANPDKMWQPEELLAYVLDDEPPFEAGVGFTYSDTNYILLGMIIEQITGNDFYEEARERVLKPLGLASFAPTNTTSIPMMAQGYYTEGTEYALGFKAPFLVEGTAQNNMQFEWTGGGYVYKNADYAQLLKALYEGKAFDLDRLREDYFNYVEAPEIRGKYGMGIIRYEFPGFGEMIGHSGFFPGYNTAGFYHTQTGQVFTMQINSTEGSHLQKFFRDYLFLVGVILN